MATQIKNYLICSGDDEIHYFDLSPFYHNWWASVVDSLPTGISALQDAVTESVVGFAVDYSALSSGTNEVVIEGFQETEDGDSIGEFSLIFEKAECTTEQDVCCSDEAVMLVWLGREGGVKQWIFPGVKEFDVRVGDANTFKNADYQLQYSERKNIYTGKRLTSGNIVKSQADFLDELKYSIQVWELTKDGAVPIVLNNDSFFKYKSTDNFYDVAVQYVIAEQIIMQTQ